MKPRKEIANVPLSELNTYVSFDFETTGINSKTCEIIEIAAVKVEKGDISDAFQTLVKPKEPIPRAITQLTGISNKMVATAPTISDVLPNFLDFIGDNLLIGHNIASYDLHILNRYSEHITGNSVSNFYVDTLHLAQKLFPGLSCNLLTLSCYCNVRIEDAHRALADSKTVHYCFLYMMSSFPDFYICPKQFIPMNKRPVKSSTRQVYEDVPDDIYFHPVQKIDISNKILCLTGLFNNGSKEQITEIITKNGGICKNSVTRKTDFLVIGEYGFYSSKTKTALNLQKEDAKVLIVSEDALFDFLLNETERSYPDE